MRRRHTADDFMSWVNKLKAKIPNVTFSTDLIVGFPGETEEDFKATRDMCNEIDFDQEFIFRYSKRRNTPAAQMPNQLDEDVKMERNQILLGDLETRLTAKNQKLLNTEQEVLVEGPSKRNSERWNGRSINHKIVIFDPQDDIKVGDMIKVKITKATQHALYGEYISHLD